MCVGVFDGNLHDATTAGSTRGWYDHIRAAWAWISQVAVHSLVEGMHHMLSTVIEAEGQWTFHR
jgi:hypothetical protein